MLLEVKTQIWLHADTAEQSNFSLCQLVTENVTQHFKQELCRLGCKYLRNAVHASCKTLEATIVY